MPVSLVSRNTIVLPAGASAVDDYYLNHKITVTRTDSLGKQVIQTKEILDYFGSSRTAIIDGLWQADFVPAPGDKIDITPKYPDSRVSINPAIQSIDYITSKTYGRGLDARRDLKLDTWLQSARVCDIRSDIYVKYSGTAPTIGAIYSDGYALWWGTVAEVINGHVRFTDCIGKLSYKWNNWRSFVAGTIVYHSNRAYEVVGAGVKTAEPTHTSGVVSGLSFLSAKNLVLQSGGGVAQLAIAINGNPVRFEKNGAPASGYTLYDSDGVDYFRLLGWNSPDQREVTRHQTNLSVDTSLPLFENMNSLLQHFGGILRYSGDKYALDVEEAVDPIANNDNEPRNITADHIIGKISISDEGVRGAYNSLTVAYSDPSNKFEARNISFFNSEYLKADRNVPKKGNLTIPGVTNYYNARILADKYLTRSRFGLTINLNLTPRGILLQAGKVIQLQYPRYGWTDKKFRIENLTYNDDCTVDVVATEYDDSFYVISNISRAAAVGLAGEVALGTLDPPTGLTTTNLTTGNELVSAIELIWNNSPGSVSPYVTTEIYASYSAHLTLDVNILADGITFQSVQNPHGLDRLQKVVSNTGLYGLQEGRTYYVRDINGNQFNLSLTKGGPPISSFTPNSGAFTITTATIIGEVTPPTNSFVDTVFDVSGSRVQKFYWLRYKINQQ